MIIVMNQYGPVLAKIRREKNIKAENIARHLGLSNATYSQIETGRRSASLERVADICAELEISLEQFLQAWRHTTLADQKNVKKEGQFTDGQTHERRKH